MKCKRRDTYRGHYYAIAKSAKIDEELRDQKGDKKL